MCLEKRWPNFRLGSLWVEAQGSLTYLGCHVGQALLEVSIEAACLDKDTKAFACMVVVGFLRKGPGHTY